MVCILKKINEKVSDGCLSVAKSINALNNRGRRQ
jgi:hypothetical protein